MEERLQLLESQVKDLKIQHNEFLLKVQSMVGFLEADELSGFQNYLQGLDLSPKSQATYSSYFKNYLDYVTDQRLNWKNQTTMMKYLEFFDQDNKGTATLRAKLTHAIAWKNLGTKLDFKAKKSRNPFSPHRVIPHEDLKKLIKYLDDQNQYSEFSLAVQVQLQTALAAFDVFQLSRNQLEKVGEQFFCSISQKTRIETKHKLSKRLSTFIQDNFMEKEGLFIKQTPDAYRKWLTRVSGKLNIQTVRASLHSNLQLPSETQKAKQCDFQDEYSDMCVKKIKVGSLVLEANQFQVQELEQEVQTGRFSEDQSEKIYQSQKQFRSYLQKVEFDEECQEDFSQSSSKNTKIYIIEESESEVSLQKNTTKQINENL